MTEQLRAMYPSTCPICEGPIIPGDPIAQWHRQYIHTHCAPGADDD